MAQGRSAVGRQRWKTERQFGWSVGLVLVAAAAWFAWRGRGPVLVGAPAAVGGLLVAFGLAYPRALVYPNRAWMALAEALSFVSTRVILGVLFFLVFTPLGAWRRMRGWDPLNRRAAADRQSFWHAYSPRQADPKHYERMF
jgi:thiol:disulfide interchange protein